MKSSARVGICIIIGKMRAEIKVEHKEQELEWQYRIRKSSESIR